MQKTRAQLPLTFTAVTAAQNKKEQLRGTRQRSSRKRLITGTLGKDKYIKRINLQNGNCCYLNQLTRLFVKKWYIHNLYIGPSEWSLSQKKLINDKNSFRTAIILKLKVHVEQKRQQREVFSVSGRFSELTRHFFWMTGRCGGKGRRDMKLLDNIIFPLPSKR